MGTTTKLTLEKAKAIAKNYFSASDAFLKLDPQLKDEVMSLATIDGPIAKCSFFIPGERPELGKVILVLAVNRADGSITEIDELDF